MNASPLLEPPADTRLVLVTFGEPALLAVGPSQPPTRLIEIGKPLALMIFLSCARERGAERSTLGDLLWSHMERDRALNALRQTVWLLRSRIGDGVLATTRDRIALAGPIDCDRDSFLAAAAAGDVDRAVALYRGDFMPGFAAPGGAQFEEWADAERTKLRRIFIRCAHQAARQRLTDGHARDALTLARRARDVDPAEQASWRLVLECLIAGGDAIGAHVEADAVATYLDSEDLDAEPATAALLAEARALSAERRTSDDPSSSLVAELVGREREFALVMHAWDEVREGHGRVFHIVAPAGLGKTRFIVDVQNRLRAAGVKTVYLRADIGLRDISYALAGDVAARLAQLRGASGISSDAASTLIALNPSLSLLFKAERDLSVDDEALRRRVLALRELIAAVADETPFALIIDDLHWSDTQSFRVLEASITGLAKSSVLLLAAGRLAHEDGRRLESATAIPLKPLNDDATAALMGSIADLPNEAWVEPLARAIREASGGSPLLILETLQLLLERGLIGRSVGQWTVNDLAAALEMLGEGSALRLRVGSLTSSEAHILLLLGVAGVPLAYTVLSRAAAQPDNGFSRDVATLEKRGLISHSDNGLTVSHDEYAAAALETAPTDAVRRAATAVGKAILTEASTDVKKLSIAASLLARDAGANHAELSVAFDRFVRAKRSAEDHRPDRALAREVLGTWATPSLEVRLVRSLPWVVRARLLSTRRIATVASLVIISMLGVVATLAARAGRALPQETALAASVDSENGEREYYPIPLETNRWPGRNQIDVIIHGRAPWRMKGLVFNGGHALRPDGRGWTSGVSLSDSGVIDIFDLGVDGTARRLTYARLDDYEPSWAPDNSRFVFVTSQWSQHGHYDLAVYDTLTRSVRQLTQGDDTDTDPQWSPDGSRIAFKRQKALDGSVALCVTDVDGANLRCLPPEREPLGLHAWADAHRIFLRRVVDDNAALVRVDVDKGVVDLEDRRGGDVIISPDGQFAVCHCPRPGFADGTWIVYPVERPNEFVVLRAHADSRHVDYTWAPTAPRPPFIERATISVGLGAPLRGVPHQLRAQGFDSAGNAVTAGVVRWNSEDTTIATIDSAGLLSPRHAGTVTVVASFGGWRKARLPLSIVAPASTVLFDETWIDGLKSWRPFGVPFPKVVESKAFGRGFFNNGDGSFFSGAYTIREFDTRGGLWVEADVSSPITASESQEFLIELRHVVDARWFSWDHVTGDGPPGRSQPAWNIRYPSGVGGPRFGQQISAGTCVSPTALDVPATVRLGTPFRVTMQLFPDGRCALALNGKILAIGRSTFDEPAARVLLEGNSVGTQIIIGHLRVGSGLAPSVNWLMKGS